MDVWAAPLGTEEERQKKEAHLLQIQVQLKSCVMAEGKGAPAAESAAEAHMSLNSPQVQSEATVASLQPPVATTTEDEDESEDESDILEESPCGRWQKRREEVRDDATTEVTPQKWKVISLSVIG